MGEGPRERKFGYNQETKIVSGWNCFAVSKNNAENVL
jgi:hypothetical protein